MTFWIDANLDPDLAAWLGARYRIIAKPIREIGLREAADSMLIAAAKRFGDIVIITKDADFGAYAKRHGSPPQCLWLRCGNLSTVQMQSWLAVAFPDALRRLELAEACVEIFYDSKS